MVSRASKISPQFLNDFENRLLLKSLNHNNNKGNSRKNKTNMSAIKRGDRILTEEPFVYALQSKYRTQRCDQCLACTKVMKCSKCQYVNYCGRSCQTNSWPIHKIECPMLKRIRPRTVPDAARVLCKIIIKLANGGDMERGFYSAEGSRKFRDLMSHYAEIKSDDKRLEHLDALYEVLSEMMQGTVVVPNKTELMSIYGRLITNGFNILDGEMHSIATAIYLGVSVTDHSCKPNAVATFEGTTLHIHAIEDMPSLDGSKIFISYIDLLSTAEQRRAELLANYYFLCMCEKCENGEEETQLMLAAACPNRNCSAALDINANNCAHCGSGIFPKHRQAYKEAMDFTKMHLDQMKDMAYLDVCRMCLRKQRGYLHTLNLLHVKTLDAAFEASIAVKKWADALDYGSQLLPGFRKYYGNWNPLLGLLYMKLAKIQLYENYFKEALHNLQEANKIIQVTHGRDHSLLQTELRPMLMQTSMECKNLK